METAQTERRTLTIPEVAGMLGLARSTAYELAATDRLPLPTIRFHDLRHPCATLLLGQGVHPKVMQERLGHADIAMTMNLYSHVTADMQRQAADQLDAAIEDASKSA